MEDEDFDFWFRAYCYAIGAYAAAAIVALIWAGSLVASA